jgi:hypothetical protein
VEERDLGVGDMDQDSTRTHDALHPLKRTGVKLEHTCWPPGGAPCILTRDLENAERVTARSVRNFVLLKLTIVS